MCPFMRSFGHPKYTGLPEDLANTALDLIWVAAPVKARGQTDTVLLGARGLPKPLPAPAAPLPSSWREQARLWAMLGAIVLISSVIGASAAVVTIRALDPSADVPIKHEVSLNAPVKDTRR